MKRILLLLLLFPFINGFAQEKISHGQYSPQVQQDGITISVADGTLENSANDISQQRLFLQFSNDNTYAVTIKFIKETHYGSKCYGCENEVENVMSVTIPAKTTYTFDKNHKNSAYYIFKKDNKGFIKETLTDFKLTNITIQANK